MPIRKQSYNWMTPEKRQQILNIYQTGMTLKELSDIVGYSDTACKKVLNAAGIEIRSRRWLWNDKLDRQLIHLCNSGLHSVQVADRMNLKVSQVLNRVNVLRYEGVDITFPSTRKKKQQCK